MPVIWLMLLTFVTKCDVHMVNPFAVQQNTRCKKFLTLWMKQGYTIWMPPIKEITGNKTEEEYVCMKFQMNSSMCVLK